MPITATQSWQEWVDANEDPYGKKCVDTARRLMELLDEVEEFDCHELLAKADKESEGDSGITGFMAGAVAQMVSTCHSRGEEFRLQWNAGYEQEGEGIVNPAILRVKTNDLD